MGGLRERTGREMVNKYSVELITNAVKRMLPKNKLSRAIITKLNVYENGVHNHESQKPIELVIEGKR
jgi:large subunit ribosomal protein L13